MVFIFPLVFFIVLDLALVWEALSLILLSLYNLNISFFIIGNCLLTALSTGISQYLQVSSFSNWGFLLFSMVGLA
jgi:hypothetical protein